jgi:hypothetical protein
VRVLVEPVRVDPALVGPVVVGPAPLVLALVGVAGGLDGGGLPQMSQ